MVNAITVERLIEQAPFEEEVFQQANAASVIAVRLSSAFHQIAQHSEAPAPGAEKAS